VYPSSVRSLFPHLAFALIVDFNTTVVLATGILAQILFVSEFAAVASQPFMHFTYKTLLHIRHPSLPLFHLEAFAPKIKKRTPASPDTTASPKAGGSQLANMTAPTNNRRPIDWSNRPAGIVGFGMAYFPFRCGYGAFQTTLPFSS
jgi:hypothetical protein